MNREIILRRRVRALTWFFIFGLVFSGVTAIPLEWEMELLTKWFGIAHLTPEQAESGFSKWLLLVRDALKDTNARYPFIAYGFDWLAFGHIVIAIAFVGLLRDPVRNIWLFDFGIIACVLVIPWAFIFGEVRGIPIPWRLIDCAFGVIGIVPLLLGKKWAKELSS
ncbi:MAG: hypothetical protein ACK4UN_05135, partial [Limisphaerales bacterium]